MMSRPYRILMFSPAFAPLNGPEPIVNSKLASVLIAGGWDVTVISRDSQKFLTTTYEGGRSVEWDELRRHVHEIRYDVGSTPERIFGTLRSALLTHYLLEGCRWAERAYRTARKLHRQKPFELILSRASPDIAHLPAMMMHERTQIPWIANWNDPSDLRPAHEYGSNVEYRFGFFQHRLLYAVAHMASWHTFPSERLRHHAESYLPGIHSRSSIIPHLSMSMEKPKETKHPGIFVLCHAGDLSVERNPENLFQSIRHLAQESRFAQAFRLCIVGKASDESHLLASKYDLHRLIDWKGPHSHYDTMEILKDADVLLVQEVPCLEGIFLPSKFTDYVQTGHPILAVSPAEGTLHDILSTQGGGLAADCRSVESITRSIEELFSAWENGSLQEQYGSAKLFPFFSPEKIMTEYQSLIQKLAPDMCIDALS